MAAEVVVGSVAVEVQASARGFARSLRQAVVAEFRDLDKLVERQLADTRVRVPVTPDVDRLRRDLQAALPRNAAITVPVRVPKGAGSDAARQTREVARTAERATPPVKLTVDVDRRQVTAAISRLGALLRAGASTSVTVAGIGTAVGAGATAIAGLASATGAAIPAILGLGAAVATASGTLVAVPGAIAVAGAAIGTLRVGLIGLEDAFKAVVAGDAAKLAEALKQLAPNAQAAVKELDRLRPAFDRLRLQVQQRLFAGTAATLRDLANATLPTVTRGMTTLAQAINTQVVAAVRALNTAATQSSIATVFAAAGTAVANLGDALAPLGRALLDVVRVGAQLTAELSAGVGDALADLAARISAMAASGELRQVFLSGLDAAGQLLSLGRDIVGIFAGIARAADAGGGGLFAFFDRLNEAINSAAGQHALVALFDELGRVGQALTPVLLALVRALVPVAQGIADLAIAFAPSLTTLLGDLGQALGALGSTLGEALAPLADILGGLITSLAPGVIAFVQALGQGLQTLVPIAPLVGQALSDLLAALAPLLPVIGVELARGLTVAAGLVSALAAALGPLIGVIADGLTQAITAMLPVFTTWAQLLLPIATQAGIALAQAFAPLVPVLVQLAQAIAGQMLAVLPQFAATMQQLVPIIASLAAQFGQALLAALVAIAPHLPQLVRDGLQLSLAMLQLLAAVAPLLPPLIQLSTGLLRASAQSGGLRVAVAILSGAIRSTTAVITALGAVLRSITAPFSAARGAAEGFGRAASSAASNALNVFRALPGQIRSAVGSMGSLLYGAGQSVVQGMINGIRSMVGSLADTAASMARSALNAAKAALGIGSPSKAFATVGRDVVAGFTVGVEHHMGDAQRVVDSMFGALAASPWPGGFDNVLAPANAGGSTAYNIYPQRADFTVYDLEALQRRQDALMRVGRPG